MSLLNDAPEVPHVRRESARALYGFKLFNDLSG